jgi:hypothetical protein
MWIGDGADQLARLETMTHGYYAALSQHGIVEDGLALNESKFADWLHRKTGIGGALGWSYIINQKYPDPDVAFQQFFVLLDEYRHI